MSRYCMLGCYGEGNLGDEAILSGLMTLISKSDSQAEFTVFVGEGYFMSRYATETVLDLSISIYRHWLGLFLKLKVVDLFAKIIRSDVLIIGGGELIRDDFGLSPLISILEKFLIAKAFGKKVLILGIGVGSLKTALGKKITRFMVDHCDGVITRDSASCQALAAICAAKRLQFTTDVAFALPCSDTVKNSRDFKIAVSLRDWPSAWSSSTISKARQIEIYGKFAVEFGKLLQELQKRHDCEIVFIPFRDIEGDSDLASIKYILSKSEISNFRIEPCSDDLSKVKKVISGCDLMIGMRLHSCILALTEGVPTVTINYDPKNTKLMNGFNMQDSIIDMYHPCHSTYFKQCEKVLEYTRGEITSLVASYIADMIVKYDSVVKSISSESIRP